jgi:hypothetical protein
LFKGESLKYIIEIEKFPNKDYTMRIYEGNNIFAPVFIVRSPKHWNKIITALGLFLENKKFINIFQDKAMRDKLSVEVETKFLDGEQP